MPADVHISVYCYSFAAVIAIPFIFAAIAIPFIFQKHYNLNLSREHVHCTLYTVLFWFKKCTNCSSSVHIVDQIFLIWFGLCYVPFRLPPMHFRRSRRFFLVFLLEEQIKN